MPNSSASVGWLIDDCTFDQHYAGLAEAVTRQGHLVKAASRPAPPYGWDDAPHAYRRAFPPGSCVVTLADIDLVTRVRADQLWTPGVFATVEHFYCSHYYAHLGRYLLNRDYIMLPFAELPRQADFLFDTLGRDDRLFIRPDSPLKTFTGLVVSRATFARDLEFMAFYDFPVEDLVVVSRPQTIAREWRFVVAERAIVAGSQYKEGSELTATTTYDPQACQLAAAIVAGEFSPDPVHVIDIGQTTDGAYHLLEIGGFSFASLYGCDKDAIVRAVSATALRLYSA